MPTRSPQIIQIRQEDLTLKYRWDAVLAVREAVKAGVLKEGTPLEIRIETLKALGNKIIEVYSRGRQTPILNFTLEIVTDPGARGFSGGAYSREGRHIMLDKPSLVSFLHELAHHIQYQRDGHTSETYARRWSLGLFKRAMPRLFAEAVAARRLYFVEPIPQVAG